MVIARAGNLFIFGLSTENLDRLKLNQPIRIDLFKAGGPEVLIYVIHGETEDELQAFLSGLIGPNTIVTDTREKH